MKSNLNRIIQNPITRDQLYSCFTNNTHVHTKIALYEAILLKQRDSEDFVHDDDQVDDEISQLNAYEMKKLQRAIIKALYQVPMFVRFVEVHMMDCIDKRRRVEMPSCGEVERVRYRIAQMSS
eukprot:TRINITY_DN2917_c0_g1_i1.p1 TRINITY_DN2917_c0_g1~~TRINITY_DN2917_c0_g1_i1.p1  ORF type:complete len:123 (-),score=16.18 TRINITY_DN2917_c0_g1_i1:86-454(-)